MADIPRQAEFKSSEESGDPKACGASQVLGASGASGPSGGGAGVIFQHLDRSEVYPYKLREYARRLAWEWVQWLLIRPSPRRAFSWRRFWLRRFGAVIDPTSATKPTTRIVHPWLLTLGPHTMVADGVTVYNLGPIVIGGHTLISQDVYLCAGTHDHAQPHLPLVRASIVIGSGVWVCAGAFVGPGVTIGDNTVVGARSVVVKDLPPGVIAAGHPARVRKPRPMGESPGP